MFKKTDSVGRLLLVFLPKVGLRVGIPNISRAGFSRKICPDKRGAVGIFPNLLNRNDDPKISWEGLAQGFLDKWSAGGF